MTSICKGTVFLTKRPCTKLATKNELCPYHQAQRILLDAQAAGETFCRQFNRGCRNLLTTEDKSANLLACKHCRDKFNEIKHKTTNCQRKDCEYKTEDKTRFCGKHARDVYREDAEKKGIRYCNIDRGCVSVLKDDERICGLCVDKNKQKHSTELETLRNKIPNCLKCLQQPKTITHFCETCYPTIYQVSDKISYRTANNFWNDLCKGAVNRSMLMVLTFEQVTAIICRPCFYCGRFSDSVLNGLDRYDNSKGYIPSNVQPCCTMCNMMKHDMPPQAFFDKVQRIHTFKETTTEISDDLVRKWQIIYTTQFMQTYNTYKNNVINYRKISFELTKPQYQALHSLPCYLCGIKPSETHKNGIDRVDSSKGYTIYNCKTCCTHCNIMKKNADLPVFLEQCKRISAYCKISEEVETSVPRLKERVESYKNHDIYELLKSNQFDHFSKWAKEVGKSAQFIQGIREIYALPMTDKDKTVAEIQHQMDVEVQRAFKERHATESAKHYSAASVYAMLMNGESEKFKGWYETTYGLSASFVIQLTTLIDTLKTSEKSAGLELCRKFLKAETSRRKSMIREGMKKTLKVPVERSGWTAKAVPTEIVPEPVPENVIIFETLATPSTPIPPQVPAPKQWKAETIYKAIKDGHGQQFKLHCESNNTINDVPAWETQWAEFYNNVFEAKEFKNVKEFIRDFIVALRSKRHAKLTQKDVVGRADRQVWPKHSVLKAYQSGKLGAFKEFNESNGESGPKWESRWTSLVDALGATTDESEQLTIIQKFQTNVRTARYLANKREVT